MSGIFGSPKTPEPPPPPAAPPPPPGVDEAKQSRMQADELRRRQGRAASILTKQQGMLASAETPKVGTKKLLGE